MADYKIFETDRFISDMEKDFSGQKNRIRRKLTAYIYPQLREQPYYGRNIKKLKGYKPETWRYRVGDYRFFYTINQRKKIVFMLTADLRGEAY